MKRVDLIRHLETHGAQLLREGGNHSVYVNRAAERTNWDILNYCRGMKL
jgi:predicted RNA binding protein YcfA (HicA-like mRNA interferase family)